MNPFSVIAQARSTATRRPRSRSAPPYQTTPRAANPNRKYVFLCDRIDGSEPALVLMQAIRDFTARYGPTQIRLVAPEIDDEQVEVLAGLGVQIDRVAAIGVRSVRQLRIRRDSFVLLNTTAVDDSYLRYILRSLRSGALDHAFWFVHEEESGVHRTAPSLFDSASLRLLQSLVESASLTLVTPSQRVTRTYNELLETTKVRTLVPRIDVDDRLRLSRSAAEYEWLDFVIVGAPSNGAKGHLLAIAALHEFLLTDHASAPARYRDFTLTMVGIGDENDYFSRQLRELGDAVLGDRLRLLSRLSDDSLLEVMRSCNATICSSLSESFGLFVAKGMAMGHVVLRGETGGIDEQLQPGTNGYLIELDDTRAFAAVFETILNREKTTAEQLRAMGEASQRIIDPCRLGSYADEFERLLAPPIEPAPAVLSTAGGAEGVAEKRS
jgi:glycosyltransferase involved in cell wall biosynthesis